MIQQLSQNNNYRQWAVIGMMGDTFRIVTNTQATRERNLYGYDILHSNLTAYEANEWLETYRTAVTIDFSDMIIYDMTDEPEQRNRPFEEYDIISIECLDGIRRTGTVLLFDETHAIIEVGQTYYLAEKGTEELIASVEDWSWNEEYNQYLDDLREEIGMAA